MPNLGPTELIIILVIIIAIFGAGKLAGLGGALGSGVKDFRAAVREGEEEPEEKKDSPAAKAEVEAATEEPAAEAEGGEDA